MVTIIDPPNSVWPNGLKVDSEGYVTFYPMGTNKVDITTITWPDGDKLVSPFVYKNDKLVGFVDTKALTVSGSATTTMNYSHIEADFASISEGKLTVNAPNAAVKKFSWGVGTFKYIGCKTVDDVKAVDPDYLTNDIIDGVWSENLENLEIGYYEEMESGWPGGGLESVSLSEPNPIWFEEIVQYGMFQNCSHLTSFTSDLPKLTDGYQMFYSCPLTTFSSDLSSLTDAYYMFYNCDSLKSFSSDLPELENGSNMFYNCDSLKSFSSDLPELENGSNMFYNCDSLKSFSSDLSSLTNADHMFYNCTKLATFTSDLPSLIYGWNMFDNCFTLTSFTSDLSSLTYGGYMFRNCTNLTSFSSDLSSLTNGCEMFYYCKNLTSFTSDLPSLMRGDYMFYYSSLDAESVKNIIDTINTYSGPLDLGMGCNNTTEDKDSFAQEAGYDDMASLLSALQAKGWTAYARYNGRPTTTYSLRRPSEDALPVFVKLEEIEEEEKHADYTLEDGSKKYRLNWFHETTGSTEGYAQFNSLEEAIETLNIKPIERN